MKYITIDRNEDFERARIRVKTYLEKSIYSYYASSPPETYMGNKKVMSLRERNKFKGIVYKVEGPGFIIDRLYSEIFYK